MGTQSVVFLMGPPGAGKGTQAEAILRTLSGRITVVQTSEVLAEMFAAGGPEAERIKEALRRGTLAPPALFAEALLRVIHRALAKGTPLVVVDGSPRTLREAELLTKSLDGKGVGWLTVIIDVPRPASEERISHRVTCTKCRLSTPDTAHATVCTRCGGALERRPDDTPEALERRWQQFEFRTLPVLTWMRARGHAHVADGNQPVPDVTADLVSILEKLFARRTNGKPS